MIHQLIFAYPRPGMTEAEFGEYWLNHHAVEFAAKIPQIARYKIDLRLPELDDVDPLWCGVAEIWLRSDADQLASMQTTEFLDGARADEPRWAAFWRTLVLDTESTETYRRPGSAETDIVGVKVFVLVKRREGTTLAAFRGGARDHAGTVATVPGLRTFEQCFVRDGAYAVGEAALDAAFTATFDDADACRVALDSVEWKQAMSDLEHFCEARYVHRLVTGEHWIIGPEYR